MKARVATPADAVSASGADVKREDLDVGLQGTNEMTTLDRAKDEDERDCMLISARDTARLLADILADTSTREGFDSMSIANVAYGIGHLVERARPVEAFLASTSTAASMELDLAKNGEESEFEITNEKGHELRIVGFGMTLNLSDEQADSLYMALRLWVDPTALDDKGE